MSTLARTIRMAVATLAVPGLHAQTQQPPQQDASVPAYRSAFEGYKPFAAGDVQDWRKSNDTVREIGGWRAYAREIQGGQAAPGGSAPESPPPGAGKPADPHQGHRK
jgi:hypothetical protein